MPTTALVDVNGTRLRVCDEGEGPPLLLVAGIGSCLETWGPLARLLPGRRLISFDAPGTGASPALARPWRMPQMAATVAGLLDALSLRRVDVLGFSFGGALAQQLAHDHPTRVRRLILAGTTPGAGGVQNPMTVLRLLNPRFVARLQRRRSFEALAPLVGGRTRRCRITAGRYEDTRLLHPPSQIGYSMQALALCGWTSVPWLRSLPQPTLVLAGDDDPLVPVINSKIFERLIPDCRRHVVPGGGHLFPIDEPESVAGVIDGFLGLRSAGRRTTRPATARRRPALALAA